MASAERWIGSRQRWSGIRARPSQERQKRVVAEILAVASSTSSGSPAPQPTRARRRRALPTRARGAREPSSPRSRARDPTGDAGLPREARVSGMATAFNEGPLRGHAAVVESRLADELDLDMTVEAFDGAHEHVIRVVVRRRSSMGRDRVLPLRRPHRERIANLDPSRRRLPGRHEDVGSRLVRPLGRMSRSRTVRAGTTLRRDRGCSRRCSAHRSAGRRASRSRRRARRARPCGSSRETRSPRWAGTARAWPRSANAALPSSSSRLIPHAGTHGVSQRSGNTVRQD